MLIKILVTILGIFFLLAFESFFMTLCSFSIFIIIIFILMDKINWKKWVFITTLISLLIDIIIHRSLGVTLFSVSISISSLYLLFMIMPKERVVLSYFPYFISIFLFYILIIVLTPLIQSGVLGVLTWQIIISSVIKSLVSAVLIWGINMVMDNFRSNKDILI